MGRRLRPSIIILATVTAVAVAVLGALWLPPGALRLAFAALVALIAWLVVRLLTEQLRNEKHSTLLETEMARQTTTLLDSLAATATAERELRLVMEAVPDAIMLLDPEGKILSQNEPAREFTSAAGHASVATVFDLLEPSAEPVMREQLQAAFSGTVRSFEAPFTRNRTRAVASIRCAPVRDGSQITKVLALVRDITDNRRAETQVRQAEKLMAMGQMVSGVAHEINNPAAIISGFAQTLLLEDLKPDQQEMMRMIHDEASRIGRITGNLLAFARAGSKDRSLVDVNDIVRRTLALRSYHFASLNITVALELDPASPQVWGHSGDLQQLLLNLLINAEHAIAAEAERRSITMRTRSERDDVRFECEDTGHGIPADIKHRVFDPFFTTKPEGVGTGLGLSICYGIVRDHGGRISVESEPGKGATFVVVLPRDPRTQNRPEQVPAKPAPSQGTLTVLFVDDEPGLRKAVARYLNRNGIQVRAVSDGAEALKVVRTEDFDVIVSDIRMPGVGGRELLAGLRRDRPDLVGRLLFSSGDTAAPDTAALLRESGVPSIVKPFDFAKLEQVIREIATLKTSA